MKKSVAALLSLVLTLGMSTVALAATPTPTEAKTIPFNKVYVLENDGTVNPAETFNFTVVPDGISGATMPSTAELPAVTISSGAVFGKGDAKLVTDPSPSKTNPMLITLPVFKHVGVYTYNIKEVNGKVSGVTYDETDLFMRVQVTEVNNALETHTVFYYGSYDEYDRTVGTKVDKITNKYSAGNLAITKNVTGNFGERDKYFEVTVTFTVPVGLSMNSDVTYEGGKYATPQPVASAVTAGSPVRTFTQTIEVKDEDTVTFKNLPYGVTYTVAETDYSTPEKGGYITSYSAFDGNVNSLMDTVVIRNDKNLGVDTGISLDSIPYVLLLGFSVIGIAVLAFKRRKQAKF